MFRSSSAAGCSLNTAQFRFLPTFKPEAIRWNFYSSLSLQVFHPSLFPKWWHWHDYKRGFTFGACGFGTLSRFGRHAWERKWKLGNLVLFRWELRKRTRNVRQVYLLTQWANTKFEFDVMVIFNKKYIYRLRGQILCLTLISISFTWKLKKRNYLPTQWTFHTLCWTLTGTSWLRH